MKIQIKARFTDSVLFEHDARLWSKAETAAEVAQVEAVLS